MERRRAARTAGRDGTVARIRRIKGDTPAGSEPADRPVAAGVSGAWFQITGSGAESIFWDGDCWHAGAAKGRLWATSSPIPAIQRSVHREPDESELHLPLRADQSAETVWSRRQHRRCIHLVETD